MSTLDLSFVDQTVDRLGRAPEMVIPILQAIQGHYRYLPQEALERVCQRTAITPASITGVASFYTQFRHRPVGRHIVSVCHGTACHVKGSQLVQEALDRRLGLTNGQDTDPEGLFTVRSLCDELTVPELIGQFGLEPLREYLRRSEAALDCGL